MSRPATKRALAAIRARCECTEGHWLWGGGLSGKQPRIWAPNYTQGGKMTAQNGRRAVWHVKHRKALPAGWNVYVMCREPLCLNPEHIEAMTKTAYGEHVKASGSQKGSLARIIANRKINRARSDVTEDLYEEIRTSAKTGVELAAENGICRTTISRIRTGKPSAFEPVGGLFTGLMAVNDIQRRTA